MPIEVMDINSLLNDAEPQTVVPHIKPKCKRGLENLPESPHKRAKIEEYHVSDEESDSERSPISSRRSTVTSISSYSSNDSTPSPGLCHDQVRNPQTEFNEVDDPLVVINSENSDINSCKDLINVLSQNYKYSTQVIKISFVDRDLPKVPTPSDLTEKGEKAIRQDVIAKIHEKYVEPLLDITGYRWVRKEVPSKGRGLKVFSIKYSCSQQSRKSCKDNKVSEKNRSRHLSHPLKQYDCESLYSIKYIWSTQNVEVNYKHLKHPPYKRLPEKLKPFIRARLDMKALELYHEILKEPKFSDVKHLIFFGKVQSYWSKERTKNKEKTTKEAFKQFFQN
ncbi:DEHA2F22704p [Debaryomyces hansenii CBS767]|jgi:hypothetical protein|uniref:DEHA2F22704p n=1 Tax=Debaryomyces hansenii (strain ATCC 36239 / CBS 767 / BCRC 21394 / JCM 1990 / NBRC 0083 / IGC 2968) TaxID=284592 RepID=Q6BKE1_DEBHA|nr:DEHA2F22704p [Debaryomyces hansenii CBS767]CAG89735.1 DEHA2F22704p [Debaryomyces hansenii CBS767]|eukprot:XP_461330.1 DEHA2F22704p [Debaryomyces hansenii CBS767]